MFKKLLIANRGEIAVRVLQSCRELGIKTIALYEAADQHSLHVRLADECVLLKTGFMDGDAIIKIAQEHGADALHPGYGYLAEEAGFARACTAAGITFIGPRADVIDTLRNKTNALEHARAAGFPTVASSPVSFDGDNPAALADAAQALGYPVIVKSCSGGRGPGERLVRSPERLLQTVQTTQAEAQAVYGRREVYLERAIMPAHQVGVTLIADQQGRIVHFGDHEGSLVYRNRKLVEEAPAPCLPLERRQQLWTMAVELARLFKYDGLGTVEFLVDEMGGIFFTEIKARIQTEHSLNEMLARVDLVREQIRIAAGEALSINQEQALPHGHTIMVRVNAEDPLNRLMPSPGLVRHLRLPGGSAVRVDTHVQVGYNIPAVYTPLVAKLTVWGQDRAQAVSRMQRALSEFNVGELTTNQSYLQEILRSETFAVGCYTTASLEPPGAVPQNHLPLEDLAAIAAVLYLRRSSLSAPVSSERLQGGWYRSSRRLPE